MKIAPTDAVRRNASIFFALVSVSFFLFLTPSNALAQNWVTEQYTFQQLHKTANINLVGGMKFLDQDDWDPVDKQKQVGLDLDYTGAGWPISITGSFFFAWDDDKVDGVNLEIRSWEANLGLRKIWYNRTRFHPFIDVAGSIIMVNAEKRVSGRDFEDDENISLGGSAGGGLYVRVFEQLNLGFNVRYSTFFDVSLYGNKADPGGIQAFVLIGYQWKEAF